MSDKNRPIPDAECAQSKCARPTTGCWGECNIKRNPILYTTSANIAAVYAVAAQPAPIPGQTGNTMTTPICERKTNDIMQRDGYQKTGYVLMGDDPAARICVSDQGAVSWFTRDQWNWLMHNRDHIEFTWPKPIEPPAGNALTEEAKDAALKVEGHLKSARDALQRLEAALSVLHEDRDPIMAATITSVALVLDGDIEAAREAINAAIASHIKAGQAGKEGS